MISLQRETKHASHQQWGRDCGSSILWSTKRKGWAWTIAVILTIIAIVIEIVSVVSASLVSASYFSDLNALVSGIIAHIIGIAINGVILYYLYRPNVKAYFGKSPTLNNYSKIESNDWFKDTR